MDENLFCEKSQDYDCANLTFIGASNAVKASINDTLQTFTQYK